MKKILILLFIASSVVAGEIGDGCYVVEKKPFIDCYRLADAIYKAEGGKKAKVPYGILSVRVSGEKEAREVCIRTINNNWKRWNGKGNFIDFLSLRYCPVGEGNRNWRKNVKFFYDRG